MATSDDPAQHMLQTDGDFDLIISDVRRGKSDHELRGELPDGVRFIEQLRAVEKERQTTGRYAHIPSIPVIFYSSMELARLRHVTESVRGPDAGISLARGVEMLMTKVLETLSDVRSQPINIVYRPPKGTSDTPNGTH
jgi:CheY-like chemotaxis protein